MDRTVPSYRLAAEIEGRKWNPNPTRLGTTNILIAPRSSFQKMSA